MKYLGIDYGTKRIGLAISDDNGVLAFPKSIIENTPESIKNILTIVKNENIQALIIGKSLDAQGFENKVQKNIDAFVKKLSIASSIEIIEQDERGSSIAAASHLYTKSNIANEKWTGKLNAQKREHNDAYAATIILQRFLDRSAK
jgi:putative Holliday junction resolvase